jgi:hypothetical protein
MRAAGHDWHSMALAVGGQGFDAQKPDYLGDGPAFKAQHLVGPIAVRQRTRNIDEVQHSLLLSRDGCDWWLLPLKML